MNTISAIRSEIVKYTPLMQPEEIIKWNELTQNPNGLESCKLFLNEIERKYGRETKK